MSGEGGLPGEPIDFEVLKETWCKYQVSDGTKINMREVLLAVRRVVVDGIPRYSVKTDTQTTLLCDPKLRGKPAQRAPAMEELSRAVEQHDMRYDTISADHSSYLLDDRTKIKINVTLVDVSRTTLYDPLGDRIYLLGQAPLIHITLAPECGARPSP